METLKGRFAELMPFERQYFNDIYEIEINVSRLKYFADSPKLISRDRFADILSRRFQNHYHQYFLIKNLLTDTIAGYIYSYNFNAVNGTAYMAINSDETFPTRCVIVEGGLIFVDFLFRHYDLRKIYADIYSFNGKSVNLVERTGFIQEANLQKHKFYDGEYHSLFIFALYRESFYEKNLARLEHVWKAQCKYL